MKRKRADDWTLFNFSVSSHILTNYIRRILNCLISDIFLFSSKYKFYALLDNLQHYHGCFSPLAWIFSKEIVTVLVYGEVIKNRPQNISFAYHYFPDDFFFFGFSKVVLPKNFVMIELIEHYDYKNSFWFCSSSFF